MDDSLFIRRKNIVNEDDEVPKGVDKLRTTSDEPFSVKKDSIRLKFWLMPAVRVSSVSLVNPRNVDSYTVSYIKPSTKASKERIVAEV